MSCSKKKHTNQSINDGSTTTTTTTTTTTMNFKASHFFARVHCARACACFRWWCVFCVHHNFCTGCPEYRMYRIMEAYAYLCWRPKQMGATFVMPPLRLYTNDYVIKRTVDSVVRLTNVTCDRRQTTASSDRDRLTRRETDGNRVRTKRTYTYKPRCAQGGGPPACDDRRQKATHASILSRACCMAYGD